MCRRLICFIMLVGLATSAWAAQIVYEGFEGLPNADLEGSSGGIGWAAGSAWTHTLGTSNTFTLIEPGMPFSTLETTGLKVVFIANGDYYCDYERPLASPITVDASNPEVWVSALIEIGSGSGDNNAGRGIGVEMKNGETNVVAFGKGINKNYGVGVTMTGGATFVNISTSRSVGIVFMALKLSWTGTGTNATVYYATGQEEGFDLNNLETFTDSASTTLTGAITFDRINLYGSHGGTTSNGLDEIRVGQSYMDVIAPPNVSLASDPSPVMEAVDVPRDVTLSWSPGQYADQHDVYFGDSFDGVDSATNASTEFLGRQSETAHSLDGLDFDRTYYWRIDEINAPPDNTIFKGDTWSFTTESFAYPIVDINVTASSSNRADEVPENTINGSGLDDDDLHSSENVAMWLSSAADPNAAWIQYEFGRVHRLHQMIVWNHNTSTESAIGFGIKEATIEYSVDGAVWTTLGTTHEFAQAPGLDGYAANTTVDLGRIAAKFIKITANSNWGGILAQYGLSEVRFSSIPVSAREPSPDSGATGVGVDVTLVWRAGREAATHDVYLSTDEQAVIDGDVPVATVTDTSYSSALDLASAYFWRIDEVNEAETPTIWQGDVWNLSTQEYLVVDDFESYNDIAAGEEGSNLIYVMWKDGLDNPSINGSTMGYNLPYQPTVETSLVYDGQQSVPLFYDNTVAAYSEVTASVGDLQAGQDWSKHGIKGLTLRFYGDPNNVLQQMYVTIDGAKVAYDGDAENLARTVWQMWYIDLASLGVNLSNVGTLSIGFERIGTLGGQGMVLLDGIRLYSYERQLITPIDPGPVGLQAQYQFEGNTNDSSSNGRIGTAQGEPTFAAGRVGQAISLDGLSDYVTIAGYKGINADRTDPNNPVQRPFSVACWINMTDADGRGGLVNWGSSDGTGVGGQYQNFHVHEGRLRAEHGDGRFRGATIVSDGQWHHVAMVVSEGANLEPPRTQLYVDGLKETEGADTVNAQNIWNITEDADVAIGIRASHVDRFFNGMIDDARIYERVLTPAEVAGLAGRTQPFDESF